MNARISISFNRGGIKPINRPVRGGSVKKPGGGCGCGG